MRPRTRSAFPWLLALLAVASGRGAARAQTEPTPTFPSRVELITVDAVVVDAKGNPVQGLTRDDFLIREDGQSQEISTFEAIMLPGPGEAAGGPPEPAPTPPPRIATNAPPAPEGSTFLVVVDDIHLTGIEAAQTRKTLERFLRETVGHGDRVRIASTETGAAWSGTLPADRDDLLAFVGGVQGRSQIVGTPLMTEYEAMRIALYHDDQALQRAVGRYYSQGACAPPPFPCGDLVRGDAQNNLSRDQGLRAASLGAIQRAIEGLGKQRGRKAVLLISEGFIHEAAPEDAYRRVVAAAQRANAAIYFVDVRGPEGLPASASAEAPRSVGLTPPPPAAVIMPEAVSGAVDMMSRSQNERFTPQVTIGVETMADDTGGLAVRNTNDLAGRLNRISREWRSYYLLGYRPARGASGSGFRKIDVKVKRGGVTVRARKGYSLEGTEAKEPQDARAAPGAEVPLRLATYTLEPGAERKTRVVAVTEIDVSALSFQEREGRRVAQLDVRLEATPRDGGNVQGRRLSIEAVAPEAGARGAALWRTLRLELALPAGVYEVRATVADAAKQGSGVASQRVVVPDPSAFHVSTPVLSDAATPAADASGHPVPVPVAHERFSSANGQPLYCGFQVFGATRDASTGRFDVLSHFVLKNREGRTLAAPEPSPMALSSSGQLEKVLVLPLPQLPAGEYELALTVEDRVAAKERELVERFSVEGAPVAVRAMPPPPVPSTLGPVAPVPPELVPILGRAGRYVVEYSKVFSNVLAQEDYRQDYPDPNRPVRRYSRADIVFVTLPGAIPWATFRDVYEVDGNKVRDHSARLEKLFVESSKSDAVAHANAILTESSRFNLGPVQRTVNIPTLALLFLHPDNQSRFAFEGKGRGKVAGVDAVQIGFVERARPTVVGSASAANAAVGDVPASGRMWIEPETGAVLRTDVDYDFALEKPHQKQRAHAHVVTEYRREDVLGILVPSEMREAYQFPVKVTRGFRIFQNPQDDYASVSITAVAGYSRYRRFEVTTDETFRPTDKQ